jgi:ABC-2 type transport system ATP-binding protein
MGLDPGYRRLFVEYLGEFAKSGARTVFLTSHIIQDMEMLIDDCMILDYGKILLHEPTDHILKNFRRFTFTSDSDGKDFEKNGILWNTSKTDNRLETYSFASGREVAEALAAGGRQIAGLKEETLSLEDAFIGLTGKY